MATAFKLDWTHEGDEIGSNVLSATELWHVTVDSRGDHPTDWDAVTSLPQPGQAHPDPKFRSLEVTRYRASQYIGPTDYIVEVIYEHPMLSERYGVWRTTVRAVNETERLTRDARGQFVGHRVFLRPDQVVGGPEQLPAATHVAATTIGNQLLVQTGAFKPFQIDRIRPVMEIAKSTTLPLITDAQLFELSALYAHVNNAAMWSMPPRTVLFSNMEIEEEPGRLDGQATYGVIYHISLQFLFKPDGWTPEERYVTHTDDHGYESPVYSLHPSTFPPPPEMQTIYPYAESNLLSVFDILAVDARGRRTGRNSRSNRLGGKP